MSQTRQPGDTTGTYTFYTPMSTGRPVRLCEATRAFAWESLHGKYGSEAVASYAVTMDDVEGFDKFTPIQKHDAMITRIAATAPLRICPDERICGAATLGLAIRAQVPATFGGQPVLPGMNHLTCDFDTAVREGLEPLAAEIARGRARADLSDRQAEFLASAQSTLDAMRVWHARYLEKTGSEGRDDLYALLRQVPFGPSRSFHEAVQSLWFCFAFTRLTGNWPGLGCIDRLLGPYLGHDLESGVLTLDEAREILASLFIKGCEWIEKDTCPGSGDAQHYQNIVIGGTDKNGDDVTNEVTYLILDVVEELSISDYPITVRLSTKTPERLLRRVAEVIRHGGGIVAFYNEDVIFDALRRQGYPEDEIYDFANDGCWEVQIPGKTRFSYCPFDSLSVLQRDTLRLGQPDHARFDSFEQLYATYLDKLRAVVDSIGNNILNGWIEDWKNGGTVFRPQTPFTVVSLFEKGCVESARSYAEGGTPYTVISPHIGGAPDAGNSLYIIDEVVFKRKMVTLDRFLEIVESNWEGEEVLRQYIRHHFPLYGNDDDTADGYTTRLLNDFADLCRPWQTGYPVWFPPGVSTFGRQIEWAPVRFATFFGSKAGEILAGNASPTPGTDTEGATAVIKSYCKADLRRQTTGAALDIRLFPGTVDCPNGVDALMGLLRGFVTLGGYFMQLDISDAQILREAQERPEDYKTLSVRVSGWNARFVTLNREWQNMIIQKTEHSI